MFEGLGDRIQGVFKELRGEGRSELRCLPRPVFALGPVLRDTVDFETPARSATSFMVARFINSILSTLMPRPWKVLRDTRMSAPENKIAV